MDHSPDLRPMIANLPRSSLVAVKFRGIASGFSSDSVAPLIGWPASSLTIPTTRLPWAAAEAAIVVRIRATKAPRIAGRGCVIGQVYPRIPRPQKRLDEPGRLVQKDVNQHTCDRYVEPDGQRPPRDGAVPVEACLKGARQRHDSQREHGRRQRDVCDEDCVVQRPHKTMSRE